MNVFNDNGDIEQLSELPLPTKTMTPFMHVNLVFHFIEVGVCIICDEWVLTINHNGDEIRQTKPYKRS